MSTVNKKQIADTINESIGLTKIKTLEIVDVVVNEIVTQLNAGNKVVLNTLGVFSLNTTKPTTRRNPKTGEEFLAPAKTKVKFSPAKTLKDSVVNVVVAE